jgi:hypothetical protein
MDHSEALQLMATEKYLLDEFPREMREQFEEHFFTCPECAIDLRMAAAFIEHSKKALVTPAAIRPLPAAQPRRDRAAWLRPAFAIPLFAVLLAVIGYQAFVVHPAMSNTIADLKKPQILASAYLSSGVARGSGAPVVTAQAGQPFVLFVDLPSDRHFTSYTAEMLNPTGSKVWSLNIPAAAVESAKDSLPIQVTPSGEESGQYALVVRGTTSEAAPRPEIARYSFQLQLH